MDTQQPFAGNDLHECDALLPAEIATLRENEANGRKRHRFLEDQSFVATFRK